MLEETPLLNNLIEELIRNRDHAIVVETALETLLKNVDSKSNAMNAMAIFPAKKME